MQMFLKMVGKTKHRVERLKDFMLSHPVLLYIVGRIEILQFLREVGNLKNSALFELLIFGINCPMILAGRLCTCTISEQKIKIKCTHIYKTGNFCCCGCWFCCCY